MYEITLSNDESRPCVLPWSAWKMDVIFSLIEAMYSSLRFITKHSIAVKANPSMAKWMTVRAKSRVIPDLCSKIKGMCSCSLKYMRIRGSVDTVWCPCLHWYTAGTKRVMCSISWRNRGQCPAELPEFQRQRERVWVQPAVGHTTSCWKNIGNCAIGSHSITWGNSTAATEASMFWHTRVARVGGFTIIVLQN